MRGKYSVASRAWWHRHAIGALEKLKQEDGWPTQSVGLAVRVRHFRKAKPTQQSEGESSRPSDLEVKARTSEG